MNMLFFGLELINVFCIFRNILHSHTNIKKLSLSSVIAASLTLFESIYLYFYEPAFPYSIITLVIIFLLFTETWYFKLCWLCICSLILTTLPMILTVSYCMVTSFNMENNSGYYRYSDFIVLVCIPPLSILLRKKFSKHADHLREIDVKGYILILFVAFIDFFLSSISPLLFANEINALGKNFIMCATFITILISIILLFMYFRQKHYHFILQQANLMNQKMLELEKQHYKDLQRKNQDLRAFRHDYNYHITAMQGLAAGDDLAGLKKYVEKLSSVKEQIYDWNTNHSVADAIVNHLYENLPAGTEFQLEGKLPENLFIEDSDLCIVLSNLLKNAVEAVVRQETRQKRKIYVSFYANEEYVSITIENTSPPYENTDLEQLSSTKNDMRNHGFGLKNVRSIVDKYYGTLDLQYENSIFTACAVMRNVA